jgi:ketosteroid isomerase-like protein
MIAAALVMPLCANSLPPRMPKAQKHESRREINQLEEEWRNALLNSNVPVLNSLLADNYMAVTSFGTLQTKDQTLAGLRSGRIHFTTLNLSDRRVRFYGRTALVTSRAEVLAVIPEGGIDGSFRYTNVYVRNAKGAWKIVSFEASRIREPGVRK